MSNSSHTWKKESLWWWRRRRSFKNFDFEEWFVLVFRRSVVLVVIELSWLVWFIHSGERRSEVRELLLERKMEKDFGILAWKVRFSPLQLLSYLTANWTLDGSVSVWIICCCCFSVGFTHSHNRYYCKFGLSVTEQTPLLLVSWRVMNFIPDFFFDAGDFWFPNLSLFVGMCYSLRLQSVRRWRAKVGQLTMRHVLSLLLLLCPFLSCAASFVADWPILSACSWGIMFWTWEATTVCFLGLSNEPCFWVVQVADELVAEFTNPDSPHISPDQVLAWCNDGNVVSGREGGVLITWEKTIH